jgi:hypothetical protein
MTENDPNELMNESQREASMRAADELCYLARGMGGQLRMTLSIDGGNEDFDAVLIASTDPEVNERLIALAHEIDAERRPLLST